MCEEAQMTEQGCRALETEEKILAIDGVDSFLLNLDLNSILPSKMTNLYTKAGDELGLACLLNMTQRINHSLLAFKGKVGQFEQENRVLDEYLRSHALGRHKRVEIGTWALLISLVSFALSSTGLAITEYRLNQLTTRMNIMTKHLDKMKEYQKQMNTNIEFLYEEKSFIGVQTNVLTAFVNDVQSTHACDLLKTYFEYSLSNLETRLDGIYSSIVNRKLTLDIVDRNVLDIIVQNEYFRNYIYLMNPSALYTHGQLDLISLKGSKLSVMITFPAIDRIFKHKRINIVETPKRIVLEKMSKNSFYSFLLPISVPLENASYHLEDIRSDKYCIRTRSYTACDVNSLFSYNDLLCLSSILEGNDNQCNVKKSFVFDYEVAYTTHAALIAMTGNTQIVDSRKNVVLYHKSEQKLRCTYLLAVKNLVIKSDFRQEKLFESKLVFHVQNDHASFVLPTQRAIVNLTIPKRNHTNIFKHVEMNYDEDTVDIYFIIGVTVASTVVIALVLLFVIRCGLQQRVVDGSSYYTE